MTSWDPVWLIAYSYIISCCPAIALVANVTCWLYIMTSSNGNIFRVTGPLCREFTGHRWIPPQKAMFSLICDVFFDFLWIPPKKAMFSLICAWINGWVNNREAGDLRRHHAHHDVTVIYIYIPENRAILGICDGMLLILSTLICYR